MKEPRKKLGCRVEIVDMLHSPARTRAVGELLIGQRGTVADVLRGGTLALVELDADWADLPGGVRRWPVQWDDLLICTIESGPDAPGSDYRLGLSGSGRDAIQHAVSTDTKNSLCGEEVYPLHFCGWSISFTPTTKRACAICVQVVREQATPDR
ncbi:hypothetical protein ETD86_24290 [Nonomuraea turkmeniaca]|uniref:Uncharacterized protein n=1 Tax=Nonomuraea turkmeniaca TaxID=103838 RepID=A0A5S4FE32_9ACTN|nr:hypothetical protein [Nonomuraea turkmeniaca]TMR16771.1 hypothetical protein ETD86_24290 [Nonomuraea turkmeniaca]